MKKNFAIALVRNLRRSKIQKCTQQLGKKINEKTQKPEMACVLGMVCVTANQIRKKQKKKPFLIDYTDYELPDDVREFAGMDSNDGRYETEDETRSLLGDNDGSRHSFKRMAKTILKYQKQL